MAYELTEQKKVGLGLLGFGILFTFLGVMLFFDRGLLALGNIFWLTGVALLLGWRSTWNLFTSKANLKGSVSFLLGLFFLFVRWPIVGIILEIYGCLNLFGRFWPSVKAFLYEVPMLGWIIRFLFWSATSGSSTPSPFSSSSLPAGRGLAIANVGFWCFNLYGFLLPVYLPRAFKKYY